MSHRSRGRGAASVAIMILLAACGGDGTGPGGGIPEELVGVWVAEPACLPQCGFTFASVASPSDTLNVTAFAGFSTEVTINRNGTFLMRTPGQTAQPPAQVRAEAGVLIVTDAEGVVDTLDYTLPSTHWLDVRFRRPFAVFDFTGDGVPDPARVRGVFCRRGTAGCST